MTLRHKAIVAVWLGFSGLSCPEAKTVEVKGTPVNIVLPDGHCELGTSAVEREIAGRTERDMSGSSHVLALFAECRELVELKEGRRRSLSNYGQVLVVKVGGQVIPYPRTRAEFVERMGKATKDQASMNLRAFSERAKKPTPLNGPQEDLGTVASDEFGFVKGALAKLPDRAEVTLALQALTLVKGYPIAVNRFQVHRPDLNPVAFVEEQRRLNQRIVSAN